MISKFRAAWAVFLGLAWAGGVPAGSEPSKVCALCDEWNRPQEPFRIFGNTYYVGMGGLAAILIASRDGLILLDGALPQSAPLIAESIRKLGFRVQDVRLIVNSHTHFDHAGGIASLQRMSGAEVAASPQAAMAFERGEPTEDDPQFAFGRTNNWFPSVQKVRRIADQETLRVGELAVKAHFTPGHTPGGTTWTWRSCEAEKCLDIVYADSLNAVSAPSFKFTTEAPGGPRADELRRSIRRVEVLPCDVLLSPHPDLFDMAAKIARRSEEPRVNPFIDSQGCKTYAAGAKRKLDERVEGESAGVDR